MWSRGRFQLLDEIDSGSSNSLLNGLISQSDETSPLCSKNIDNHHNLADIVLSLGTPGRMSHNPNFGYAAMFGGHGVRYNFRGSGRSASQIKSQVTRIGTPPSIVDKIKDGTLLIVQLPCSLRPIPAYNKYWELDTDSVDQVRITHWYICQANIPLLFNHIHVGWRGKKMSPSLEMTTNATSSIQLVNGKS